MGDHFGVGGRLESVALVFQPPSQRTIVLDHAIVNDCYNVVAADVRMGVFIGGRAVRGPTRMPQTDGSADRRFLELGHQVVDPAGRLGDRELAVAVDRHHAGAVVAAILEPAQAFDQKIGRPRRTDVSHNATHANGSRKECEIARTMDRF
jgi:hypothetical protein